MKRHVVTLGLAATLCCATSVEAHLMNSGFGPFYDGLWHPFVAPDDLLPLIAAALLAGLGGRSSGRSVLFALPLAWISGMAAAAVAGVPSGPDWLVASLTIGLGVLVAADRTWPVWAVTSLAVFAGAMHGIGNGSELAATRGGILAMAGIASTLFVASALIAGQVTSLRAPWARIAVRVAGSWIAAIGLLMFGWATR